MSLGLIIPVLVSGVVCCTGIWIHAIAYHAIAPHVVVDAPLIARTFAIR